MPNKIRAKLKPLGEPVKREVYPAKGKSKTVTQFPSVTVSSDQMDGLKELTFGKKCRLVFEAEVTAIRKPTQWDIDQGRSEDDVFADFKLIKGAFDYAE